MRYTNNAIFTVIRESVLAVEPSANLTQTYNPTPSKFPTVFAREIGRLTPTGTATISNAQDIYETTWEVQVVSDLTNGSKERAYTLMGAVKDALRGLYFVETSESPLENSKDYYTLAARFRRVIGGGETMPNN